MQNPNFKREITVSLERKSSKCLNFETNGSTVFFRKLIICKNLVSSFNGAIQKSGNLCFQGHLEELQAELNTSSYSISFYFSSLIKEPSETLE